MYYTESDKFHVMNNKYCLFKTTGMIIEYITIGMIP